MAGKIPKYDEDLKKSIVSLHQNRKSQNEFSREYGISITAIDKWIKIYSDTILNVKQIKELQKRNALLEEENIILKKAIAIFTPHSNKD